MRLCARSLAKLHSRDTRRNTRFNIQCTAFDSDNERTTRRTAYETIIPFCLFSSLDVLFIYSRITYFMKKEKFSDMRVYLVHITRHAICTSSRNRMEVVFPNEEIAIFVSDIKWRIFVFYSVEKTNDMQF